MENGEWLKLAAFILGPGGAAYIGVKISINGLSKRVNEAKTQIGKIFDLLTDKEDLCRDHEGRIGKIEGQLKR